MAPPGYWEAMVRMMKGGVKASTEVQYEKHFMEFWRTMRRLGMPDDRTWSFPTDLFLLQIYIIDCAVKLCSRSPIALPLLEENSER